MDSRFKCVICGFVSQGAEAPSRCSICGAGSDKFIMMPEPVVSSQETETVPRPPVRIVNVLHPDWTPCEMNIGRLKTEVISISQSEEPVILEFEKDSIIAVLDGSGEVICDDEISRDSYFPGSSEPNENIEEKFPEEEPSEEKTETEEEKKKNIPRLQSGMLILIPANTIVAFSNTSELKLILLKITLK